MENSNLTKNHIFTALLTELKLTQAGHLFPVLYSDKSVIPVLISHLQSKLDGQAVFKPLEIGSPDFAADLDGKTAGNGLKTIFHLKLEMLPEEERLNVTGRLQTVLSKAEEINAVVILWMTPLLDRIFSFSLPGISQKLTSVFDFTDFEKTKEKTEAAFTSFSEVFSGHVSSRLKMIARQYHHWQAVTDGGEEFLLPPMGRKNCKSSCLPLYFTNRKGKSFLLDQLFNVFLENKTFHMLTLLGCSHTGKTGLLIQSFVRLAEKYIKDPKQASIPIFINLEGFKGRLSAESFLLEFIENVYRIRISLSQLYEMLLKKHFVFLVYGFDRMEPHTDDRLLRKNFNALSGLTFQHLLAGTGRETLPHKIFVISRPHLFLSDVLQQETHQGYTALYMPFTGQKEYQLVRVDPPRYDPAQIKPFVIANTSGGITARNMLAVLDNPYYHKKISSRPLLWEMATRVISLLKDKKEVNIADIYAAFTGLWIDQDNWRSCLTGEGKKALMHQLAGRLFEKGPNGLIQISSLSLPPARHIRKKPLDSLHVFREDIKCCEFTNLDKDDNISFIHPSFFYYFFADHYFQSIRNGKKQESGELHLPEEVKIFLKAVVSSEKSSLAGLDLSGMDLSDANLYNSKMAKTNLGKAVLTRTVLIHADLQGADLTAAVLNRARMSRIILKEADLTGADFSEAMLKDANLENARFNGASFRGADLRGVKLQGAKLAWVDLSEADLRDADLSGANLSDTDLSGADLTGASLNEANLTNANLCKSVLKNAEISSADLSYADLTGADLSHANFSWSKLHGAVLSLAVMHRTRLREADLTRSNLNDADLHRADGRWANLSYARLKNTSLREADFTGADLRHSQLMKSDLTWINLSNARLENSNLSDANLKMAKMMDAQILGADLSRADLTWADLTRADMSYCVLKDTNLSEADLTDLVLIDTDLESANIAGTMLEII